MSPHSTRDQLASVSWRNYGISNNGFLPALEPLQRLPETYYAPWEHIVHNLPSLLKDGLLRYEVDQLEILSTSWLVSEPERQRAYVILSFLTQAYIWGGDIPSQILPPAITIPFLQVSSGLHLPPVATFASLNLWNWRATHANASIGIPDHLSALHTLTGTVDEEWFYMISVAVEAKGAGILRLMVEAAQAAQDHNVDQVTATLHRFQAGLRDLSALVERMHERCDPQVFYHQIRPLLAGSRNMEAAGLPHGVFYDEGEGKGEWRKYRGGSNGQSSLIQFFDVMLGVEHTTPGTSQSFHEEMRTYMPGQHAEFLEDMALMCEIRPFVQDNDLHADLVQAFNLAVASVSAFRDVHMQLVARYIIVPSRSKPPADGGNRVNLANASKSVSIGGVEELHGTGGTKLMPFLKQTRDETVAATIT